MSDGLRFSEEKTNSSNKEVRNASASLRPLYLRSIVANFGNGVVGPYLPAYAVQLGASPSEMGWFRSVSNLFGNIMQVPWGMVSDKLKKRVPFIILGGILSSLLWLPMIHVRTPEELIGFVALQAFVSSMVAPVWSALIGDMVPQSGRGSVTASINASASLGSIVATLISGYIMMSVGGTLSQMYMIPLILTALCGFGASLTMLTLREQRKFEVQSWTNWRYIFKSNPNFRFFCLISVFHSFFMSMAWPIFPITLVRIVKADMLQIGYLSAMSGAVSLVVRRFAGRLTDRAGRKPLVVAGRAGTVIVPAIYAIATSIYHLLIVDFFTGFLVAASEIAVFAYLLDVTPEEQRAASFAFFNTVNGLSTFVGSLAGGYLASTMSLLGFDELASLQFVYGISAVGRLSAGLLFMKIREPYRYPSTVREELTQIMLEDREYAKKILEEIEERGQITEEELEKDLEWFESTLRWRKDREGR